ncbi:MAG: phospho-sugar mutase, partial [Microthrixaceae bacterium]
MTQRPPRRSIDELIDSARSWIERDPDPANRQEALEIIDRADLEELESRFGQGLEFGTAGLRATLGAGPMRLNRVVARQTAAGIAAVVARHDSDSREVGIVVAHDARTGSNAFAADIVEVTTAAGIGVHLLDGPSPTPLAAFALRHLDAAAAVVVTARPNPPESHGLKVFWSDGAQIAPPLDGEIADAIAVADTTAPTKLHGPVTHLGASSTESELVSAYMEAASELVPGPPEAPLPVATSAMHGVGGDLLAATLKALGHTPMHEVTSQREPDPRFPTVEFPNPEEPGAMDAVIELARNERAALALALDPDADRLAIAAPHPDAGWRRLTGDELGALLAWRQLELTDGNPNRLVVTTVVSSRLVAAMAADAGARFEETLTGFKWLARPAIEDPDAYQVIAYEEALGYAIGPNTRDKDGIMAALVAADAVCALAHQGRTIWDVLDGLASQHGAHVT